MMCGMLRPLSEKLLSSRRHPVAAWAIGCLVTAAAFVSSAETNPPAAPHAGIRLPLFFEPTPTQPGGESDFVARGQNYQFRISPTGIDFVLRRGQPAPARGVIRRQNLITIPDAPARFVRMEFLNANSQASITGTREMAGKANHIIGNDPSQWRTQVPIFSGVSVGSLYPGVDLVYYGNERQLEYDFTIAPKANPAEISLHFAGVDKLSLGAGGELIIGLGDAELRQHRPVVYQYIDGSRHDIAGSYRLK